MITKWALKIRLELRKRELDNLDKAYMNWNIGDKEYETKRPILLGRIEELEDLCHINKK